MEATATALREFLSTNPRAVARFQNDPSVLLALLEEHTGRPPTIFKEPRWQYDSLIIKMPHADPSDLRAPLALKIHDEMFPISGHIYNSPELLKALAATTYAAHVHDSFIVGSGSRDPDNEQQQRVVLFDLVEGETLSQLIKRHSPNLTLLRDSVKRTVRALLTVGVHPLLRDLDDFVLSGTSVTTGRLVITDYNALIDCRQSGDYSLRRVMDIISGLIDQRVQADYLPYTGALAPPSSRAS